MIINADVRQHKMNRPYSMILSGVNGLLLWAMMVVTTSAATNEPVFVSTSQSNGVVTMTISAPQSQPIAMDYSYDLVEWHWLHYFIGEVGVTGRVVFVTDGEGLAHINHTYSSLASNAFLRAVLLEYPTNSTPPIVPLKKKEAKAEHEP